MEPKNRKIRKRFATAFSIVFSIIASLLIAIYIKWKQTGLFFVPETILVFAVILVAGIIMALIAWKMWKYFSDKTPGHLVKNILWAILILYVAWYIVSNTVISLGVFVWYLLKRRELSDYIPNLFSVEKVFVNPEIPSFLLVFTIIFFYVMWRKSVMREQKLREENLIFQNQTLKNQINPHFLFNSLNTLSSLVSTQTEVAEKFINRLSSIYRYILENGSKERVSLGAELSFIRDYFILYKIRDEDKIQLSVDLEEPEKYEILPVSLQLLTENAIKHNTATRESPLKISIYLDGRYVAVRNNLQRMPTQLESTGTGLKNLGERLKLSTGKELVVEKTESEFLVKVPLLE